MSQKIELVAQARADVGKGASRRLRRKAAMVPGIVYGGGEAPVSISLIENDLSKAIQLDSFFSQILALKLGAERSQVLARDMQRHPATNKPMHIDFQRIVADQEITVEIPLHFLNEEECIGVKDQKGLITHHVIEVEVTCLPSALPEFIAVDVAPLQLGDILHLSDLKLPEGVVLEALEGLSARSAKNRTWQSSASTHRRLPPKWMRSRPPSNAAAVPAGEKGEGAEGSTTDKD